MKAGYVGEGICPDCKKKCDAVAEDCGIGPYEYWGARGVHHDWRVFSGCCGVELKDWERAEPDYPDFWEKQERSTQHWEDLSEDDWREDR